jgi:hypothetical protein
LRNERLAREPEFRARRKIHRNGRGVVLEQVQRLFEWRVVLHDERLGVFGVGGLQQLGHWLAAGVVRPAIPRTAAHLVERIRPMQRSAAAIIFALHDDQQPPVRRLG